MDMFAKREILAVSGIRALSQTDHRAVVQGMSLRMWVSQRSRTVFISVVTEVNLIA
jgi:hypothetical protein